jgi:N-methylhydantoinase A/oxoprolinase/acetone carboxylase beta subunit
MIPHQAPDEVKMMMGQFLNMGWQELERQARDDLEAEGLTWEGVRSQPIAYVRYGGQMEDIEVSSPVQRVTTPQDMDRLIAAFEDLYSKVYAGVAKYPAAGYQILEIGLMTSVPKVKPKLVKRPLQDRIPSKAAVKGNRQVYVNGQWQKAALYDMDELRPGNEVDGLCVIEAPATTFFVPQGRHVRMDQWFLLWLT